MRKTIFIFAFALMGTFSAFAQTNQERKPFFEEYISKKVAEFGHKSGISQEQMNALSSTFTDLVGNVKDLRAEGKNLNFREIRSSLEGQVKEILESEEKYDELVNFVKDQVPFKIKTKNDQSRDSEESNKPS